MQRVEAIDNYITNLKTIKSKLLFVILIKTHNLIVNMYKNFKKFKTVKIIMKH